MANYACTTRTNYFRVTDEEKYDELFERLSSEDNIEDFTTQDEDGNILHGFGCYGTIEYYPNGFAPDEDDEDDDADEENSEENYDSDFDAFLDGIQKILPEDEAFILFESGNEKLRYVTGYAIIVTSTTIETLSIEKTAINRCKELLGPNFTTRTTY